jgi:hypothetical protein
MRRLPINAETADIEAVGGEWSEIEINPSDSLVLVRATSSLQSRLGRLYQRITDPNSIWAPVRVDIAGRMQHTKSLASLVEEVPDDIVASKRLTEVDSLITLADRDGYTKLEGLSWPRAARLLVLCGKRGYGLDRISTGTFPTTGILDNFNRANADPLDGNWSAALGFNGLALTSNQVQSPTTSYEDAYWTAANFGPNMEVYATIATKGGNGHEVSFYARLINPASSTTADGYNFWSQVMGGTDIHAFYRLDNNGFTQIGSDISMEIASGDKLGGESIGSTHTYYRHNGTSWSALGTWTDGTYTAVGALAIECENTTWRLDDVGGGTIISFNPYQPWRQRGPVLAQ